MPRSSSAGACDGSSPIRKRHGVIRQAAGLHELDEVRRSVQADDRLDPARNLARHRSRPDPSPGASRAVRPPTIPARRSGRDRPGTRRRASGSTARPRAGLRARSGQLGVAGPGESVIGHEHDEAVPGQSCDLRPVLRLRAADPASSVNGQHGGIPTLGARHVGRSGATASRRRAARDRGPRGTPGPDHDTDPS